MTAPRPYRVGVVGLGKIAQLHHLPNLAALPDVEIAGLCDLSADLATALADQYGLPATAAVTDVADLLATGLDGVVVANRHHAPVVMEALRARVPVFVEKPVCWGLEEATELSKVAAETGTPVLVGYMKRFDPAVERLASELGAAEPAFARIHNFAGGRHRHERLYPVRKPGRDAVAAGPDENTEIDRIVAAEVGPEPHRVAAVRTLAELAIHDLNLAVALLGPAEVYSASAHATPAGPAYLITLRHAAGATSVLEVLADFGSARDWDEQATFYTGRGSVELAFAAPFVRNAPTLLRERGADGTDAVERTTLVSRVSPFLRELEHFRDVMAGTATPRTGLEAAVDDLRLVYGIVRRLETAGGETGGETGGGTGGGTGAG